MIRPLLNSYKTVSTWLVAFLVISIITLVHSCTKIDSYNLARQPLIKAYFENNPRFSIFNTCLKSTQLDILLSGDSSFTVFAPSDSAMIRSGYTLDSVKRMNTRALKNLISYHIILGSKKSPDLNFFKQELVFTLDSSQKAYLEYNNYGIFINGIAFVKADIASGNGVVHEINRVMVPPIGDMLTTIANTPSLSFFNLEVQQKQILDLHSLPETCLAPNNDAYKKNGITDILTLKYLNRSINGYFNNSQRQYFTDDFLGTFQYNYIQYSGLPTPGTTLIASAVFQDNSVGYAKHSIILSNATTVFELSPTPFHIVKGDIICTDGVIHIIDDFLYSDLP